MVHDAVEVALRALVNELLNDVITCTSRATATLAPNLFRGVLLTLATNGLGGALLELLKDCIVVVELALVATITLAVALHFCENIARKREWEIAPLQQRGEVALGSRHPSQSAKGATSE